MTRSTVSCGAAARSAREPTGICSSSADLFIAAAVAQLCFRVPNLAYSGRPGQAQSTECLTETAVKSWDFSWRILCGSWESLLADSIPDRPYSCLDPAG